MQFKELIKYIVVTLIGLFLLNLYSANLMDIGEAARGLMTERIIKLHILASVYCFLLGVLVEWRSVIKLVTREIKLKHSMLLVPGIILLLISLMHPAFIMTELRLFLLPFPKDGVGINMLIGPFLHASNTQNILSVISGILVIKGLYKRE